MNILVTFAVDPEFGPWHKRHAFQKISAGDCTLHRAEIAGATVDFLVTGMGPSYASRAIASVDLARYAACISSGLAGALVPGLSVGTIIAAPRIREGKSDNFLDSNSALLNAATAIGARAVECLVSSDRVATSAAEKYALAGYGDAVDMESFTIVSAARAHNLRAIAIRAISDTHTQTIPLDLASAIDERGQVSIGKVLKMAAGSPGQIADLMRLSRDSKSAADSLFQFLTRLIAGLAASA